MSIIVPGVFLFCYTRDYAKRLSAAELGETAVFAGYFTIFAFNEAERILILHAQEFVNLCDMP